MVRLDPNQGAVVTYLIVGLDRKTHARWHENVSAENIAAAELRAGQRAAAQGIDLVIAAVIGPNSAVLSNPAEERGRRRTHAAADARASRDVAALIETTLAPAATFPSA
jgi:hypothetical protein